MNSVKLHIHTPMVAQLPQNAALLSVIGNTPDEYSWIMNNFINIRVNRKLEYDDFYREDMWYNCYYIEDNCMTRQFISSNIASDFVQLIIKCINNGYYIFPYLNKRYIKAYNFNSDVRHSPLIYGYNLDEEVVFLSDFFAEHYIESIASFSEIQQSIDYCEHKHEWYPYKLFHVFKKKGDYKYQFNIDRLTTQLRDYYSSTNMNGTYDQFQTNDMEEKLYFNIENYKETVFGLSCYDALLQLVLDDSAWIRLFYLFRAHKILMRYRLEYLYQKYQLPNYEYLRELNGRMEKVSVVNQNMFIKSRLKSRQSSKCDWVYKAAENISSMKKIDGTFTEILIETLEDRKGPILTSLKE